MTDTHDPAPDPCDALLADLLAALDAEGVRRPGPDAGRVAGHLAGVGDADLLEDASRDAAVRRLLAEIVREVPLAERDAGREAAPSAAVREAAVAALRVAEPARAASHGRLLPLARWAAAAAVLVLPIAGWWLFAGRDAEAGAALAVEAIERVAADGAVSAEGPRRLALGASLQAAPGEIVALNLSGGGRVVLRADPASAGSARVACASSPAERCARAGVALAAGEALVAAPSDPAAPTPVVLLPDGSRLEVVAGAARLEVGAEGADVEFDGAGRGRWTPRDGATLDLAGSDRRALGVAPSARSGVVSRALGFGDLRRFGPPPRPEAVERFVGARQWRVAAGPVGGVARVSAAGMPALAFDLPAGGETRLAWRPDEDAGSAVRAVVRVVARARPVRGALPGAAAARLAFALVGVPGADAVLEVPAGPGTDEHRVEIPLPRGWAGGGGETVLRIVAEGAVEATVLGVAFPSPFALGALARTP